MNYEPRGTSDNLFMVKHPNMERHHVIPTDLVKVAQTHPLIRPFLILGSDSTTLFDFDVGKSNGTYMPSETHNGSHPSITEEVRIRLDSLRFSNRFSPLFDGNPAGADLDAIRRDLGPEFRTLVDEVR